ncbi:Os04g0668101 [Oryza sativa Japonica Group]|uniref:Os04g0668101 protein n=1 Tax=Oryza sativa subsp. japonica TaxID=39947 RepID=A0A0P0WG23_ORYSJ|nr:Os04g0668101 [Oryza sativa Japonica Group]
MPFSSIPASVGVHLLRRLRRRSFSLSASVASSAIGISFPSSTVASPGLTAFSAPFIAVRIPRRRRLVRLLFHHPSPPPASPSPAPSVAVRLPRPRRLLRRHSGPPVHLYRRLRRPSISLAAFIASSALAALCPIHLLYLQRPVAAAAYVLGASARAADPRCAACMAVRRRRG